MKAEPKRPAAVSDALHSVSCMGTGEEKGTVRLQGSGFIRRVLQHLRMGASREPPEVLAKE